MPQVSNIYSVLTKCTACGLIVGHVIMHNETVTDRHVCYYIKPIVSTKHTKQYDREYRGLSHDCQALVP